MDQQRRLLTFTVLSFLILFGWINFGPKLFPAMFPKPPVKQAEKKPLPQKEDDAEKADSDKVEVAKNERNAEKIEALADEAKLPEYPTRTVVIGSDDPKTGFGLKTSACIMMWMMTRWW